METVNNQPKWVAEVLKLVERAAREVESAVDSFNATAEKNGLLSAIEWKSNGVAATRALSDEIGWLGDLFTSEKYTPEEVATLALKEIESRKQQFLGCFRIAASTSPFANAIENAKLEARARAFDNFCGAYTHVCSIIEHRAAK